MKQPQLEASLTMDEVLACWPRTIPAFIYHRNGRCPNCGCSIAGVWKGNHKGIPAGPGIE